MTAPLYTQADYLAAAQALMPRGRNWPRQDGAVQTQILAAVAHSYAVQNARANYLLVDAFPASTVELLPEWEATLGLPNPACGPAPTMRARQLLLLARFVGPNGATVADYTAYAALMGFSISITVGAPFRAGQSRCGHTVGGPEQVFNMVVVSSAAAVAGTAFGAYGAAVLQSELRRIAPAHTIFNFIFN